MIEIPQWTFGLGFHLVEYCTKSINSPPPVTSDRLTGELIDLVHCTVVAPIMFLYGQVQLELGVHKDMWCHSHDMSMAKDIV